jgi:hypothetical protein
MKKWLIFLNIIAICACGQVVEVTIEHPGAKGINTYYGNSYCDPNEAREMVNLDNVDGDAVKRAGYKNVYVGSDTLCDGLFPFYDMYGTGRFIRFSQYDSDSSFTIARITGENSYIFGTDSAVRYYQYINPIFGYDWVQFNNALIMANGYNQPLIYTTSKVGTMSMPTPGAPMAATYNESGNLDGSYSYKLCFMADSCTTINATSAVTGKPGPMSSYVFSNKQKVILFKLPERLEWIGGSGSGFALKTNNTVLILRNKKNDPKYYKLAVITYGTGATYKYVDNIADASLGSVVDDTLGNDSIPIPGAPSKEVGATTGYDYKISMICGSEDTTIYWAYSYYDTLLQIESELSPYFRDATNHDNNSKLAAPFPFGSTYGSTHLTARFWGTFADAIIIYYSACKDTTYWSVWDTVYAAEITNSTWPWNTYNASYGFTGDTVIPPWTLTNKIPYKYMISGFDRLWGAGDELFPNRLYYSDRTDTGTIGSWDMTFDYISLDENDGDKIMGLSTDGQAIYTYKGYSIWATAGTDPQSDMQSQKISTSIGAVCNNAIVTLSGIDYFMGSDKKVYVRSGASIQEISQKIRNSFENLTITNLSAITATAYRGEIWFSLNDTIYITDPANNYAWRKYAIANVKWFANYDTTSNRNYVRKNALHFTKTGTDSIFYFDFGDTTTTDNLGVIPILYKSAPVLTDGYYKPMSASIQLEMPVADTVYFRLMSLTGDTLQKTMIAYDTTLGSDSTRDVPIDYTYEIKLNSGIGTGFYFVLRDNGKAASLRIKKITGRFVKYAELR